MKKENKKLKKKSIPEKIKENIDLILSSGGVLLGIFIIYMSSEHGLHQEDIGGTILIASLLYILLRKRLFKTSEIFYLKPTRRLIYINNIIFFLAFSLSVWLLYIVPYYRPAIYFTLVAAACASVALEILYSGSRIKWGGIILIKILLIGIALYGGLYYEFADVYGTDTRYFHHPKIALMLERGHILEGTAYSYYPMFHLMAAETSILTSLNVRDSIFSSITFLYAFSVIFVFLIGQKVINTRTGLIAALMFAFGDAVIVYGSQTIPMSLGLFFFAIILCLFIVNAPKPLYKRGLAFFLFISLLLTHTVAVFIMFVSTTFLIVWKEINKYLNKITITKLTILWSTAIAFGIIVIVYWMYSFQCPHCFSFFDQMLYSLRNSITMDSAIASSEGLDYVSERISPLPSYAQSSLSDINSPPPYFEYILDHLGYLIFLGMGIIGTYMWLRSKDNLKVPLCLTMVSLFACLYGPPLIAIKNTAPGRWFIFIYVILSIVSAYGIFKLINLINKRYRAAIIVSIIFLISFFMIVSTISNDDNPLYNKLNSNRGQLGHTSSELQSYSTIKQVFNGKYGGGRKMLGHGALNMEIIYLDYNFSEDAGKMYVIEEAAYIRPMFHETKYKGAGISFILPDELKIRLESNGNQIYDNNGVSGYLIKYKNEISNA